MTSRALIASIRLHDFMKARHWDGFTLGGPDQGVRWNIRVGRFVKGYLPSLGRGERFVFQQGQGYWALSNWLLYDITGALHYRDIAIAATEGTACSQSGDGSWPYPLRERRDLKATVEGNWGALTLLGGFERTGNREWLSGAMRWHAFLLREIGFQRHDLGRAVNYFDRPRGLVPNNSVSLLWTLGEYRRILERSGIGAGPDLLEPVPDLLAFLESVQLPSGEFPYELPGPFASRTRTHYLCYQYNAFACMRLIWYGQGSGESRAIRMADRLARYLAGGALDSGACMAACGHRLPEVVYYAGAIGMALCLAHWHGLGEYGSRGDRCLKWVMEQQKPNGGMHFSKGDYRCLGDHGSYPRYLAMTLYHLLLYELHQRGEWGKAPTGVSLSGMRPCA